MNRGVWYAVAAYSAWGLFPVYWKSLEEVSAFQLVGHRIVWSCLLLCGVIAVFGQTAELRAAIATPRVLGRHALAAALLAVNWLIFVWAVNNGFIVEASLGYFINPLVSVLLGVVVLGERLRPGQWGPIAIATAGVLYLTLAHGKLPWIALTLAGTFGLYGLIKKTAPLSALNGVTLETGVLFLPALGCLLYAESFHDGAFLHGAALRNILLIGTGAITAAPLLLFASAARRIPLSVIGILQYIAPTLNFLLGVFYYDEPFTHARLIGFSIVWTALVLFALEGFWVRRRRVQQPIME